MRQPTGNRTTVSRPPLRGRGPAVETVTPLSSARVRQRSAQMGNRAPFQGNPVRETDLLFSRGEPPTERNFDRIIEDKPKACSKVTPTAEETERYRAGGGGTTKETTHSPLPLLSGLVQFSLECAQRLMEDRQRAWWFILLLDKLYKPRAACRDGCGRQVRLISCQRLQRPPRAGVAGTQ